MKKWWIVALAAYFVSLLWLSFATPGTFVSPDENAAFTFAAEFAETGRLAVWEPLNATVQGLVHPRSAVAVGEWLVPGSFLGLPVLVGALGVLLGTQGMLFVTPVLAVLAVVAWYQVLRRLFQDERLATVSAVLLAAHPAFWLYAARSMMHNVAFVAFLVFAAWFVVARPFTSWGEHRVRRLLEWLLAGVCVGAAIALRTSEAMWIGGGLVLAVVVRRQYVSWPKALAFVGGAMVPVVVIVLLQSVVYGSPLATGYTVTTSVVDVGITVQQAPAPSLFTVIGERILPFGFHEKAIVKNVWYFGIQLFPLLSLLAVVGVALSWKEKPQVWRAWFVATLLLAAWLGVVYGSWSFNDNPDPTAITLGDSHTRYWLPVFVLLTPFIAFAVQRVAEQYRWAAKALMVLVVVSSGTLVFFGADGLVAARAELFASAAKRDAVLVATEDSAVVIVDRADKFLWPHRSVVVPLRDESTYAGMPALVAAGPLYYFGIPFPQVDVEYLNNEKLHGLGLRIDLVTTIDDEALYRITPAN